MLPMCTAGGDGDTLALEIARPDSPGPGQRLVARAARRRVRSRKLSFLSSWVFLMPLLFANGCDGFNVKPTGCVDFETGFKAQFIDQTLACAQVAQRGACSPGNSLFFAARSFCAQTCGLCPKPTAATLVVAPAVRPAPAAAAASGHWAAATHDVKKKSPPAMDVWYGPNPLLPGARIRPDFFGNVSDTSGWPRLAKTSTHFKVFLDMLFGPPGSQSQPLPLAYRICSPESPTQSVWSGNNRK